MSAVSHKPSIASGPVNISDNIQKKTSDSHYIYEPVHSHVCLYTKDLG